MSKTCGHNSNCGCSDNSLKTPSSCDCGSSCAGETCAEVFNQECIQLSTKMSYDMDYWGGVLTFEKGERLDSILQKILVYLQNYDDTCEQTAPVGFRLTKIGKTTASIVWSANTEGTPTTAYQIEWSDGVTPVTHDIVGTFKYDIINLAADTEYTVKVTNTDLTCASVVLTFKTKK